MTTQLSLDFSPHPVKRPRPPKAEGRISPAVRKAYAAWEAKRRAEVAAQVVDAEYQAWLDRVPNWDDPAEVLRCQAEGRGVE